MLNRDDEPVIGFTADVGASGCSTLHGCNQMRITRLGHSDTSAGSWDCENNFRIGPAEKSDAHEQSERDIRKDRETIKD
jgi:hypothetical protein